MFMSEPMKPTLTEAIHDIGRAAVTLVSMAILSIPLALAIFMALALWILPEASGVHQSGVHVLSELGRAGMPHTLFLIAKQLFVVSWMFAVIANLLDMVMQQRRFREKRRNTPRTDESC